MALRGAAHTINTSASTTVVVTVSGIGGVGPQLNDVVFLIAHNGGSGTPTFTFPSGFNAVSGCPETNTGGGGGNFAIAYKIATGSEPSSYTISSTHNDFFSAQCWVFSGRNTTSPFTATVTTSATAISGAGNQSCSLTGVTAAAGDDILGWWGLSNNPTNAQELPTFNTYPSGFGNGDTGPSSATGGPFLCAVCGCAAQNVSAGATGTITAVINFSGSGFSTSFAGYTISIAASTPGPLIGQTTPTSGNTIGLLTSDIYWVTSNAFAGGQATALNVCLGPTNVPTGLLLGLFDLNGNLLASGSVATPAAGLNTATITSTNIVYGQQYSISVQATTAGSNYNVSGNPTGTGPIHAANTPNTMPSTLPGSPFVDTHGLMTLYATGSLSAGAAGTPLGGPARTSWHWRSSGGTS